MKSNNSKMHMLRTMVRRDIKDTLGRFFSVFAIIAIGTGFFSGIRITTPDMLNTINNYYKESGFFDYRMLSTIGWTDDEAELIRQEPDVRAAEGAWQYDVIFSGENGAEAVFKVHSITHELNKIQIKEGRMPENSSECLVDIDAAEGLKLGDKMIVSASNDQDTKDALSHDSFTITGFADSPLYINFERGTTSIGNGTVLGFLYLPEEAFTADAYTEMYVKLDSDLDIYSTQYNEQMDELRPEFESLEENAAMSRYDKLYSDAQAELADARQEFEEERAKGEKELRDAQTELEEGKKELDDAAVQLADGQRELDDAAAELDGGKRELDEAARELADAKSELDNGEQLLASSKAQLDAAAAKLENGSAELASGRSQLNETRSQLDEAGKELANAKAELDRNKAELDTAASMLAEGKSALEAANEQLTQLARSLSEAQAELDSKKAEIEAGVAAGLIDETTAAYMMAGIEAAQAQIDAGKEQYNAALSEYQSGMAEYQENEAAYEAGLVAYEAGLEEYNGHLAEYQAGEAAYEEGTAALEKAQEEYDAGKAEYEKGLASYNAAASEYEQGTARYNAGLSSYQEGLAEYENGLAEYERNRAEYDKARADYEDGLKEYQDGVREYNDAQNEFDKKIAETETELQDAEADLAAFEPPETFLLERGTNIGYACFESDSEIVKQIARILPLFFILVAILVCMTTMTRMVEERRGQIGTMKGLGYSGGDIMFTFLAYSGIAAASGCIIGYSVGIFLFPSVIWYVYHMMYINIPMDYVFDWKLACIVFAVSIAAACGTTFFTCRNTLSESAASLMRPKAPKAGKRVFLERIPAIWSRMKFMHKVSARNILRYKKRFFMMIVGISGCTALLITGFGLKDSIATFVKTQFEEIQPVQAGMVIKDSAEDEIPSDFINTIDELDASSFMYNQSSWDIVIGSSTKSATVFVPAEWSDIDSFFRLRTMDGDTISPPAQGEALISVSLSKRQGLNIGDVITLRDQDMQTVTATVSGVFENHVYNYVILSKETLENAKKDFSVNGVYVNFPEGSDIYKAQTELAKCDNVISVTVYDELKERISSMMSSLNYIVLLIIISAAALAFVVLYNLTNINILERNREIATIKVLGFRKRETTEYVFRENIVLTTIGMAIGLGLGVLLHSFVIDQIVVDLVYFKKQITLLSFIMSIALTFLFAFLVDRIMTVKLEKINMAESLKSVE